MPYTYIIKHKEWYQINTKVCFKIATLNVVIYEHFHFEKTTLYGTF